MDHHNGDHHQHKQINNVSYHSRCITDYILVRKNKTLTLNQTGDSQCKNEVNSFIILKEKEHHMQQLAKYNQIYYIRVYIYIYINYQINHFYQ